MDAEAGSLRKSHILGTVFSLFRRLSNGTGVVLAPAEDLAFERSSSWREAATSVEARDRNLMKGTAHIHHLNRRVCSAITGRFSSSSVASAASASCLRLKRTCENSTPGSRSVLRSTRSERGSVGHPQRSAGKVNAAMMTLPLRPNLPHMPVSIENSREEHFIFLGGKQIRCRGPNAAPVDRRLLAPCEGSQERDWI